MATEVAVSSKGLNVSSDAFDDVDHSMVQQMQSVAKAYHKVASTRPRPLKRLGVPVRDSGYLPWQYGASLGTLMIKRSDVHMGREIRFSGRLRKRVLQCKKNRRLQGTNIVPDIPPWGYSCDSSSDDDDNQSPKKRSGNNSSAFSNNSGYSSSDDDMQNSSSFSLSSPLAASSFIQGSGGSPASQLATSFTSRLQVVVGDSLSSSAGSDASGTNSDGSTNTFTGIKRLFQEDVSSPPDPMESTGIEEWFPTNSSDDDKGTSSDNSSLSMIKADEPDDSGMSHYFCSVPLNDDGKPPTKLYGPMVRLPLRFRIWHQRHCFAQIFNTGNCICVERPPDF
eukprot:scpid71368/ scgid30082/ 